MAKTHKLSKSGKFAFTKCGIPLHIKGGTGSTDWDVVDCKKCLAKKGAEY